MTQKHILSTVTACCFLVGTLLFGADGRGSDRDLQLKPFQAVKRGVRPAIDDLTFLHRVHLDLTGQIPPQFHIDTFAANPNPGKYVEEIERLLNSEAYHYRWVTFLADLFKNEFMGFDQEASFRNAFDTQLQGYIRNNTPFDVVAREILTGSGKGVQPGSAFPFWTQDLFEEEFRLEVLDNQVANITDTFLGIQTNCVSCHNGSYHLEEVNVGLVEKKREDFWAMAAFLSKSFVFFPYLDDDEPFASNLQLVDIDDENGRPGIGDYFSEPRFRDGEYRAQSIAGEGMRVPRNGGVIEPRYMFGGGTPEPGETRRAALARLLTADRQFARNIVNRVWAEFFGEGFVHPLNSWDLARLNATTAANYQTTVQPRTPALLEALTNEFINNGYDLKRLIRRIAGSSLYLSPLQAEPDSKDYLGYWRGKQRVRRLTAESIVDRYHRALGLEQRYIVRGRYDQTVNSTWALPSAGEPDPFVLYRASDEPPYNLYFVADPVDLGFQSMAQFEFYQYTTNVLLQTMGHGDGFSTPRQNTSTVQRALFMLNSNEFSNYMYGGVEYDEGDYGILEIPSSPYLLAQIERLANNPDQAGPFVEEIFQRFLVRAPTPAEKLLFLDYLNSKPVAFAVYDTAYALINHPDFVHQR